MTEPRLKKFKEVAKQCNGNISAIAQVFGVTRKTIYDWAKGNEKIGETIQEYRGRLLDKCLKTAELLANGIPKITQTKSGPVFSGWEVMPDAGMLKYLMSTLGRKEGFGDGIDITSNGETIKPEPITIEVVDRREQVIKKDESD